MEIAFFTEGNWSGKLPTTHPNMRTDLAWIHLLNATHYNIHEKNIIPNDLSIVIIPKNRVDVPLKDIKMNCKKLAIMQEGPCDYWTEYTIANQITYLTLLSQADFILCHNECDVPYYRGLTNKSVYVMPTAMVEESIPINDSQVLDFEQRSGAIIGGNMCQWYNGMVSLLVARLYSDVVYAPSMGRKVTGEDRIDGLKHLSYCNWSDWMKELNKFQVAVHLMPTVAAGTFSLNCAYLGIPCIGNVLVDTQSKCHPLLSVDVTDIDSAIHLIKLLKNDRDFYMEQSNHSRNAYKNIYHSSKFKEIMAEIIGNYLQ